MRRTLTALTVALMLTAPAAAISEREAVELLNAGITTLQGGDAAAALPLLTQAVESGKLKGDNIYIGYFSRGAAYGMLKQCPNAIPDFTKAIEIKQDDPQVYAQRGNCYAEGQQYELAIADVKQAVALAPTDASYATFLCAVAFNGKVHAEAGPACEAAVEKFAPTDAELTQASAQSYEAAGDKASANRMWKKLLALDPASEAAKQGIERTK